MDAFFYSKKDPDYSQRNEMNFNPIERDGIAKLLWPLIGSQSYWWGHLILLHWDAGVSWVLLPPSHINCRLFEREILLRKRRLNYKKRPESERLDLKTLKFQFSSPTGGLENLRPWRRGCSPRVVHCAKARKTGPRGAQAHSVAWNVRATAETTQ